MFNLLRAKIAWPNVVHRHNREWEWPNKLLVTKALDDRTEDEEDYPSDIRD